MAAVIVVMLTMRAARRDGCALSGASIGPGRKGDDLAAGEGRGFDRMEAMNEQSVDLPRAAPPDLKALIRRAKLDNAERSSVIAELRGAELARLELLRDALEPVFAQVPAEIELFDHGLVPGEKPRLFVDIIAFVEMARDRRLYRFVQDTRGGTIVLAESDKIEAMTEEIANYVARRLIEREKALSARLLDPLPSSVSAAEPHPEHVEAEPLPMMGEPRAPERRHAPLWQILLTLILGLVLGAALMLAYKSGQLNQLWQLR
jgi:hypothetical protein